MSLIVDWHPSLGYLEQNEILSKCRINVNLRSAGVFSYIHAHGTCRVVKNSK